MSQRKWNITRKGNRWSDKEIERWLNTMPVKIELTTGIIEKDAELYSLLGFVLENLGIDRAIRFGNLEDWKSAVTS